VSAFPYYAIVERYHALQNPTSADKILLLGERLRLDASSEVLDIACGRGGPALVLADRFGCRVTGVERESSFVEAARRRAAARGLAARFDVVEADAREFRIEPERFDVVLCLGATFIWDDLQGTLEALVPAVRPGGYLAVGEPYWRQWPVPVNVDAQSFVPLPDTVDVIERAGLAVVALIASSLDDWDRYETLHWQAAEEWLREHPDDPAAAAIEEQHREYRRRYLEHRRDLLGWALFAGLKAAR
jgi:SAM-dependent methyltransferase